MSTTPRRKRFNAPLARRLKAEAAKAQADARARPRFLARPDMWDEKLVGLVIEVYIARNACRPGDRGNLGTITVRGPGSYDYRNGGIQKDITVDFNWSAWGSQELSVVDAVAQTFRAAAELMQSIVEGVISMDLVLETYGVRNWKED